MGKARHQSLIHLDRAARLIGSRSALADKIRTPRTTLQSWFTANRAVPAEVCGPIEIATAGQVTRSDLRPDLWPAV